jgi:aryl-alcohol dehydrogenase-like predicted oxidoreductase
MAGTTVERRVFGETGLEVSVLGFGGSEIGYERATPGDVERLLGGALDAGLNVIDTAECYLKSEELIGRAVSHRRSEYHLFTKCGHASGLDHPDWSRRLLAESIDRSLRRLRTDHVDLIQLHSCTADVLRDGDAVEVLLRAREQGKARFVGYSGDGADARYAVESGAFDALQTSVSVADQEAVELTLPLARERRMGVIAKRPVANAVWRHETKPDNEYVRPYWERVRRLDYDFLKGDMRGAMGTALRFTLGVPGVHAAIVGTSKPGRWRENAELLSAGPLPAEEFDAIRARWKEVAAADWGGEV